MKAAVYVGVLLVLAAGGWWLYQHYASGVPVEAARVRRGGIREFVDEHGKTRLPRTHLITMPNAGRIEAIELAEGTAVRKGQTVARIVPLDLELSLEAAQAAFERSEAAIVENDDITVEQTTLLQTESFVQSMVHTVEAASARVRSGEAKRDYAEKSLARVTEAHRRGAKTEDALELAQVRHVESNVEYQQDVLVHSALVAMKAATDLMPTAVQQYIDRKKLSRTMLEKERAQAELKLREARRDCERGTLASPLAGVVLERFVSDERHLAAGAALLEIGRLEEIEIEADVLSQDVVGLKRGSLVDIHGPAIGPKPARGRVERIYPGGFTKVSSLGVEQQRVKTIIRFEQGELTRLLSERNLGVGYRVQVRIYTARKENTLVLPRSALFRGAGGDWQVFVVREARAKLVPVEIGLLNDELAEATSGLSAEDIVILAPETNLADGDRVTTILRGGEAVE